MANPVTAAAPASADSTWPGGTVRERLEAAIAYAVLAPSSYNTQPWRFRIEQDALLLFADLSRAMPVVDPQHRDLVMSCGAALFNLRTALQHWGLAVRTDLLPDPQQPELLARVTIAPGRPGTDEAHGLVAAMGRRRTHREPFVRAPLPETLLRELGVAADREGAWLAVVADDDVPRVAELVRRGSRHLFGSPAFRREIVSWMRPNWTRRPDGVPGYAFGLRWLKAAMRQFAFWTVDVGESQARRDERLALGAPALVVLGAAGDDRRHWLAAGQALERVLLTAATRGVAASFLNSPVQVPDLRRRILDLTARRGMPQVLLRIGYGGEGQATPRRLPTEVLRDVS